MHKIITRRYHILVTGSSGFLGSKTMANLSIKNKICGIDLKMPSRSFESKNINFIQGDITKNLDQELNTYTKTNGPIDFIIHYAAFWDYKLGSDEKYNQNNVLGTINMYKLAKKYSVKRFIFASSVEATIPIVNRL